MISVLACELESGLIPPKAGASRHILHFLMRNVGLNLHCKFDRDKLFDLKIGKKFALLVQVDNLLDKQVWLPNWGLAPGTSIPYNKGRALYASLNLTF